MAKNNKQKDEGMSLDEAFGDEEDVEYAESKPSKKLSQTKKSSSAADSDTPIKVKSSKPIISLKKGDKIKVDSLNLEVDANVVLIDHGATKEMAIECFDSKTDKDYQLRYFADRIPDSIEFYELDEIVYNRVDNVKKIEW
jgi:hypothetical protein